MSQAGDDFQKYLDKLSDSSSSETEAGNDMLDTEAAVDKNSSSATLQETAEKQSSKLKSVTGERTSISDDLGVMELSQSDEISMNTSLKNVIPNSSQPTSQKPTETFNLSVGEIEPPEQKMSFPLSPMKRRHPSLNQDLESSSGCKKITISTEPDKTLLTGKPSQESSNVFQSTSEKVEFVTESTNLEFDSTVSNATAETTLFKVPDVPPIKVKPQIKSVTDILNELIAEQRAKKRNKLRDDFLNQFKGIKSDSDDNAGTSDGGKPRDAMLRSLLDGDSGTSSATFETKDCAMRQYLLQSGIEASGPSSGCQELSASSIPALTIFEEWANAARLKVVQEVQIINFDCDNAISQVSFNTPTVEDHMTNFRKLFVQKMNIFLLTMEQFSNDIAEMCHSTYLHASLLGIKVNELFGKGIDLEKVWKQNEDVRNNNAGSVTVINVDHSFFECCAYFLELKFAVDQYLSSLPNDYPEDTDDS